MPWTHDRVSATEWDGRDLPTGTRIEQKWDGWRCTLFKQPDGRLLVFGKTIAAHLELSRKVCFYDWYQHWLSHLPTMSSLDCELCSPDQPASHVATAVKEGLPTVLHPFSVPWYNGVDLTTDTWEEIETNPLYRSIQPPYLQYTGQSYDELVERAREESIEGFVLKELPYANWWKAKVTQTREAVIVGFNSGYGKYIGLVGSLQCCLLEGRIWKEQVNVGGFDDETRLGFTSADIGRVIEIEFQDLSVHRIPRHPRFVRFRDDIERF